MESVGIKRAWKLFQIGKYLVRKVSQDICTPNMSLGCTISTCSSKFNKKKLRHKIASKAIQNRNYIQCASIVFYFTLTCTSNSKSSINSYNKYFTPLTRQSEVIKHKKVKFPSRLENWVSSRFRWLVAGLSQWRSGFDPRSVNVWILKDKVALRQGSLPVCPFFFQSVSLNQCSMHVYH